MNVYLDKKLLVLLTVTLFIRLVISGFPDYHHDHIFTFLNGTMNGQVPLKIQGRIAEYNKEDSQRDAKIKAYVLDDSAIELPVTKFNPTNDPPANISGKMHHIKLQKGIISYMEVLDKFDYNGEKMVPVQICTTWYDEDKSMEPTYRPGLLEEAVQQDGLLNMTFKVEWDAFTINETDEKNRGRTWEIDEYLCYYDGSSAHFNAFGKCVIPYTEIIEHYKRLWDPNVIPVAVNGVRTRATNVELTDYPCFIKQSINDCKNKSYEAIKFINARDQLLIESIIKDKLRTKWYEYDSIPSALGYAVNTTFGYNRFHGNYDINFTVLFNNWTFDFPHGFLDSYRDESFKYEAFLLDVYFWIPDPIPKPERDVPASFWIMAIIIIFPVVSLLAALMLFVCTRSRLAFNRHIWDYKNEREKKIREAKNARKAKAIQRQKALEERTRLDLEKEGIDMNRI